MINFDCQDTYPKIEEVIFEKRYTFQNRYVYKKIYTKKRFRFSDRVDLITEKYGVKTTSDLTIDHKLQIYMLL